MATHSNILTWKTPQAENPWCTAVHGVTKSWTQLKQLSIGQTQVKFAF